MPRKPEIEPNILEEKLKKWPTIFNDQQKLKQETDHIWVEMKNSLNLTMSAKSLYLYLYNNRHNCRSNLEVFFKLNISEEKIIKKEDSDFSFNNLNNKMYNPMNCKKIVFELIVPENQIIQYSEKVTKREGWTDVLAMAIWEKKRLPCSYNFKNGWITNDGFKFHGFCTDCGSTISGESEITEKNNYKFKIVTFETFEVQHIKKRKLKGQRRAEIQKILLTKTAGEYREDELAKLSTDYEPPHLNTSTTLGKAREQGLDKELGFIEFKGFSISNKKFLHYCNIRKLSLVPFYLWYWSDQQLKLWNILHSQMLPLSLDATGSLIKKYSYYSKAESKPLFVYVMVIGYAKKIIPLLQAILSVHDVPIIQEILCHWIECGARVPKEIVTDGSLALQIAISLAFNKMTFKNYNLQCYKILIGESNVLPTCYLRQDVAHLLNTVRRWKCFKLSNPTVIDFYLRCIGYLIQVQTLEQFEKVIKAIIIVANSETAPTDSICYKNKSMLLEIFKSYKSTLNKFNNLAEQSDTHINHKECEEQDVLNNLENDLIIFINHIFQKALSMCTPEEEISDKVNFYFCSEFTKNFKNLCYTFPTWTNSMSKHFSSPNEVATSTRSETNFKEVKKRVLRPIVVQKYILKDKKRITALTNFAFSKLPKDLTKEETRMLKINETLDIFNFDLESFGTSEINDSLKQCNLSVNTSEVQDFFPTNASSPFNTTKSQASTTYNYSPAENMEIVKNTENMINISINDGPPIRNLIINGNKIGEKSYNINKSLQRLRFLNTCPFDSIFELFTSAYLQNNNFSKHVDQNMHENQADTLKAIINYCETAFEEELLYANRAQILYSYYKLKPKSTQNVIHCEDNIMQAFEYFINYFPSLYQNTNCHSCKHKTQKSFHSKSLSPKQYYEEGIKNLQKILANILCDRITVCVNCDKNTAQVSYNLGSYFVLDVEYLHERKNLPILKHSLNKKILFKTNFEDIPKQLTLKDESFELTGIVSFEGDSYHEVTATTTLVHYKTYVLSSNKEWIVFNDLKTNIEFLEQTPEDKIALIMYTKG